ncbi:peptidylprolyl isomerase [Patescibacteria group bacterium]|nr:peptidylprolyl isomerase [Patescibacteria group bacterium]
MEIKEKDFIEVNFTGKTQDGETFDSTLKEELDKIDPADGNKINPKPFIFCVGKDMFLKSLDKFLIGKEIGKKYSVKLKPEEAFGKRSPSLIQRVPIRLFHEQKIKPIMGTTLNFDGRIGKILIVSGGRVMVDFNHLLAGKDVQYEIEVIRKVEDTKEKIKALTDFLFKRELEFDLREKDKKIIFKVEKPLVEFLKLFNDKFKETLDLEIETEIINEPKEFSKNLSKENSENDKKSQQSL